MGILNFIKKKYKEAKSITFMTLIFENIEKVICLFAICAVLFGVYFKFCDYMYIMGLFNFYNIDYSLYSPDGSYVFFIIKGIAFFFFMIINFLILYKLFYAKKVISNVLMCIFAFVILYISNLFVSSLYGISGFVICSISSLIFILLEMFVIKVFTDKESKLYKLFEKFSFGIKTLIFGLVFMFLSFMVSFSFGFCHSGNVKTINNEKIILYSSYDYYIVSPYDVIDGDVYVYSAYQEKISNDSVYVTKEKYNRIIVSTSLNRCF